MTTFKKTGFIMLCMVVFVGCGEDKVELPPDNDLVFFAWWVGTVILGLGALAMFSGDGEIIGVGIACLVGAWLCYPGTDTYSSINEAHRAKTSEKRRAQYAAKQRMAAKK